MLPIKKDNFPMMPVRISTLCPIEIPDMPFEDDLISKFFKNLAMKQMVKYETNKAEVAKLRNLGNKNYYEMLERTILHPYRLKAKWKLSKTFSAGGNTTYRFPPRPLKEMKLKNQILTIEAKNADLDFKLKLKELGMEEEDA